MSNRHRSQATPGAAHPAPNKDDRRAEHRKTRHRTHELLAHTDEELGEEVVPPTPVSTRIDVDPTERTNGSPTRIPGRRDYRHWKQKFWKRRTNVRAERAAMSKEEPPLPELGYEGA